MKRDEPSDSEDEGVSERPERSARIHNEFRRIKTHYNDGEIDATVTGRATRSGRYQNEETKGDDNDQAFHVTFVHNTTLTSDPKTPKKFKEAITGPDREKWIAAIRSEIENFQNRDSWIKTPRK